MKAYRPLEFSTEKKFLFLLLAFSLIVACDGKKYPVVTTFAGSGHMDYADGQGEGASFSNPMGLATDSNGNIYVADSRNNLIRKITANGVVSTIAGSRKAGSADGRGTMASFFFPTALAIDNKGNVYVADTHNNLIRKISPDGMVTTLAGKIPDPSQQAKDNFVKLDKPSAIAVDANGNVYVADWGNDVVRKISPEGKVTNLAGTPGAPGSKNGPGSSASFYLPAGLAVDPAGNVYVSDSYNNMIRKIDPNGVVSALAGNKIMGYANGRDTAVSFSHPAGIALDKMGNLYVADVGNNRIRKIKADGTTTTIAGSGKRGATNGRDTIASFYRPYGVAVSERDHSIYVADYQNNLIRKINY